MFLHFANSGRTRFAGAAALLLAALAAFWMAFDLGRKVDASCDYRGKAGAACRWTAVSQTPPDNCKTFGRGGAVCGVSKE
jgi:hypothetical protein